MYCNDISQKQGETMKKSTAGTLSGCVVWILSIGVIASCMLPIFIVIGSITSFSQYAIRTTGNVLCPDGSKPESYSYETTGTDEYGNSQPSTAYELHCVNQDGNIVKEDPIVYSFLWIGLFAFIGLTISGVLAFALAAPAGVLIGRMLNRGQKPNIAENMEPE
jgi:hypothetical protein